MAVSTQSPRKARSSITRHLRNPKDINNHERLVAIHVIPPITRLSGMWASRTARPTIIGIVKTNPRGTGFPEKAEAGAEAMRQKLATIKAAVAAGKLVRGGKLRKESGGLVRVFHLTSTVEIKEKEKGAKGAKAGKALGGKKATG